MGSRRTALVHDFLLDVRGAERVFAAICDLYPDGDIFTAVYDEAGTEGRFSHRRVNTSFLQRLRPTARTFRSLLPLYPYAMESLDLRGYDRVISSSSAWAHGVIADPGAVHVCYCHNPFRYAWNGREEALRSRRPAARAALGLVLQRWRQWDWIAAQKVDRYVANSATTAARISRYFSREAAIVHPPVEIDRFAPGPVGEDYVVLSELMPHKRIGVAIEAFNRLRRPLVVIGNGPDERRLRRAAGPTIRFAGRLPDAHVAALLSGARALVVTATEEFGIAAVEAQAAGRPAAPAAARLPGPRALVAPAPGEFGIAAVEPQAAGRPVIAPAEGGLRETVLDGVTGTFYARPEPADLAAAVERFDALAVDPQACRANAERFEPGHFRHGLRAIVADAEAGERAPRTTRPRAPRGLALPVG